MLLSFLQLFTQTASSAATDRLHDAVGVVGIQDFLHLIGF
jgi:hypothetical protein